MRGVVQTTRIVVPIKAIAQCVMRCLLARVVADSESKFPFIFDRIVAMKRTNLRKTISAAAMGGPIVATSALAQSQVGSGMGSGMMGGFGGGWMGGGYGGMLLLVSLVVVVAGLVAWIVAQKRK